ncbi:hypothetical protein D3C72_1757280 [compost metagenome]
MITDQQQSVALLQGQGHVETVSLGSFLDDGPVEAATACRHFGQLAVVRRRAGDVCSVLDQGLKGSEFKADLVRRLIEEGVDEAVLQIVRCLLHELTVGHHS